MHQLTHIFNTKGTLHHAIVLVGDRQGSRDFVFDFLVTTLGMKTSGNPDIRHSQFETLTIDDTRDISFGEQQNAFVGNRKIFIIEADFITLEAQNALLKVFEEPTEGTHFFILLPQNMLLPTLRSRVHLYSLLTAQDETESVLALPLHHKLAMVKEITDGISDEEKTKQDAIDFLNKIETELYKGGVVKHSRELALCEDARLSLYDRGAPVKIILEQVMLSL